ncbi:MAG: family 78 glycoside hydrolase catalytic domain [Lentisphaeria bacterium]|nr:family 78 glycoside hydrolase catalytic domain [Lentisphaeria bacterium]
MLAPSPLSSAKRIWLEDSNKEPNQYVIFRRRFNLEESQQNLKLLICADSDFILTMNGKELGRGQYSDDPDQPSWSEFKIDCLAPGWHLLAVLVYHKGANFSVYAPGQPGLILSLHNESFSLCSDDSWKMLSHPAFKSGPIPLLSSQLGFTAEYDARKEIPWQAAKLDDSGWQNAIASAPSRTLRKRPEAAIPQMLPFIPAKIMRKGMVLRNCQADTVAKTMALDQVFWQSRFKPALSLDSSEDFPEGRNAGLALIADLEAEHVGFIEFELEAPEGCIVDFAHGEHLNDGRVRSECFSRNFADRYICKAGRNVFQLPFRRVGARYLQLHLLPPKNDSKISLYRVGLRPWVLPLPEAAIFDCGNDKLLELRRLSIRTLELCMHEHYEDCPWREQALYTYDSRNQMLYGYYIWGNTDFAAASLNLWANALRPDGHLRLCAPTRMDTVIPMYSLIWPIQVYEHYLYSGSLDVMQQNHLALKTLVDKALAHQDEGSGLYRPASRHYWHFYEWAPELSQQGAQEGELHALYNLYMIEMLEAYAKLLVAMQQKEQSEHYVKRAALLRDAVEKHFYDEQRRCYASRTLHGKPFGIYHEHTQLLMLYLDCVPQDKQAALLELLYKQELEALTLSVMPYLFMLFMQKDFGAQGRQFAFQKLQESYFLMLDGESSSLWETVKGADDFLYAGSLCHGWSSLPAYYCAAGMLGVIPLEPGFKRFLVRPWHGNENYASGEIPSPAGNISVSWKRDQQGGLHLSLRHPKELIAQPQAWEDAPLASIKIEKY